MNKKGLIGKIFLVIGLIILLIIAILVFTAWQAYSLIQTVMSNGAVISSDITAITAKGYMLNKTDCDKIPEIEASVAKIKSKAVSTCKNPLIKMAVDRIQQMKVKCTDIPALETQMTQGLTQIKILCSNFDRIDLNQTTINELRNTTQ